MNKYVERLYNGVIKENPTFVLMLGMCPTLAVTSSAINGLGMGLSTTVVLIFSNLLISLFRKVIPNGVRMPAFIVIVASLVTMVDFLMAAYLPSLSASLGVYIPLIVVNCIILGRAEGYASKNTPVLSIFDGLGMGLGFTMGLTIIGLVREVLGAGTVFGNLLSELPAKVGGVVPFLGKVAKGSFSFNFLGATFAGKAYFSILGLIIILIAAIFIIMIINNIKNKGLSAVRILGIAIWGVVALIGFIVMLNEMFTCINVFIMAPGAFLVLAFLVAIMNVIREQMDKNGTPIPEPTGCLAGNCSACGAACPSAGKKGEDE